MGPTKRVVSGRAHDPGGAVEESNPSGGPDLVNVQVIAGPTPTIGGNGMWPGPSRLTLQDGGWVGGRSVAISVQKQHPRATLVCIWTRSR